MNFAARCQYKLRLLMEVIVPRRCMMCGIEIDAGIFCRECRAGLILAKAVPAAGALDGAFALFRYEGSVRRTLRQIKFDGEKSLLPLLAEETSLALRGAHQLELADLLKARILIAAIPTSRERLLKRGFDVPQELFGCLRCKPGWRQLLERRLATRPLFGLTPELRRAELAGCFTARWPVREQTILLCDDIYTSGATMQEAAQTLKNAGARAVYGLAFSASRDNWQ